ncbi:response regulator [Vicingaceae bacterium]|nr:response regulator [Vicingaceae bacterium]
MDKIKVLYIDDEHINLMAFKASFRKLFEVFTAASADEGMEILNQHSIEVIISDQKMPGKTGVDFFASILEKHPNPIRILMTAYSDIESVIHAINKGHIYQYINKPWNNYDLNLAIENAHQLYKLKEQNTDLNLKYKKIFSDSTDPIVIIDTEFKIINYNPATVNLIGIENLNSSSFDSYFFDKSEAQKITSIISEKKILEDYQCLLITPNGKKKVCLISGNVNANNYGELIRYQLVIKDITERSKTNQLLLKKIIETQEQERERISRDLHDGIGQSLAGLKLNFDFLKSNYSQTNNIEPEFNTISSIIEDVIKELRRVCFDTMPLVIKQYGLIRAIEELQSKNSHPDFKVIFKFNTDLPAIPKPLEISIFRIIQEFLNNSINHSCATEIKIELSKTENDIILNLKDNGIGFNINGLETFKGYGLKNIQNRVQSFNGNFEIQSTLNVGTTFSITFPHLSI